MEQTKKISNPMDIKINNYKLILLLLLSNLLKKYEIFN
ncbi:MAG: hypothetical protein BWY55_00257 [archaeon ADurb.Bin336]|nr:MAG: hypothetical protein BWY55_00257 [archaeon ADurb.Bin336]